MQIKFLKLSGKVISLEVEPSEKVEDVKERLQKIDGMVPRDQRLIFKVGDRPMVLREGYTLADYRIEDGARIFFIVPSVGAKFPELSNLEGGIQVSVCTSTETLIYRVDSPFTVDVLMEMIWEKQWIPKSQQVLTFNGIRLKGFSTLMDFMIRSNDTIILEEFS